MPAKKQYAVACSPPQKSYSIIILRQSRMIGQFDILAAFAPLELMEHVEEMDDIEDLSSEEEDLGDCSDSDSDVGDGE